VASHAPVRSKRRQGVTLLDQYVALQEQVELLTEQRDRAEREIEYFAALAQTIAKQAKLNEDDVAEIRAKVRAAHEAEAQ
jgi:predicted  nucleic acid-binding Zn-ribbon protein